MIGPVVDKMSPNSLKEQKYPLNVEVICQMSALIFCSPNEQEKTQRPKYHRYLIRSSLYKKGQLCWCNWQKRINFSYDKFDFSFLEWASQVQDLTFNAANKDNFVLKLFVKCNIADDEMMLQKSGQQKDGGPVASAKVHTYVFFTTHFTLVLSVLKSGKISPT